MHAELATSPTSGFVRVATLQRRIEGGTEALRGCTLKTLTASGGETREIASEDAWWATVIDHFGLAYGDLPGGERSRIWRCIRQAHEAWETLLRR